VGVQPAHYNDDIIFGGLGSDWLHGASGDDAISGAEALPLAAAGIPSDTIVPLANGTVVVDGLTISGFLRPYNPGDILKFDPIDANGQHANHRTRAGEMALYDEYNPLRKIVVAGSATGTQYQFLLNFNEAEGILRPSVQIPAQGNTTVPSGAVRDDGGDRIFGDLGNDWMVGGTGRDNLYAGMGNDLMNVDDNLTTHGNLNDQPDTHPTYEDRAFGGGGRDVLIGNTGGDRLIDWTGEFNSYLVPFAPFGMATVSRTMQPQLPEFLYALSFSDGVDMTRYSDKNNGAAPPAPTNSDPIPSRNGEPHGELGLILQKDEAWHDTHGGPADPQAGNIPGGKRDVLRAASVDNGSTSGFAPVSGKRSAIGVI
jgi:Ca2+-binding RTX toxin-like protein